MRVIRRIGIVAGVMVCCAAVAASAQSTSSTSTENREFEVIAVNGNELVVKTADGTRQLTVPEDFRFTVDGKPVSIHGVKAGMTGIATLTTTTTMTPVTVTEVKNGTVVQVTASMIAVRTDQGILSFTQGDVERRGAQIFRDGKPAQVSDFRPGDQLKATIVTTMPPATLTERELQATLTASDVSVPELVATPVPVEIAAPAATPVGTTGSEGQGNALPPPTLPNTAGPLPLIGLVGLTALAVGAALAGRRRLRRS